MPPRLLDELTARVAGRRAALLEHAIYGRLADVSALRVFMRSHVFAVWDFMSLLKTLQRRLTGVELPWLPPPNRAAARLVNEIVLVEETDELEPGHSLSHFELYLEGMREVGADADPIEAFVDGLRRGQAVDEALERLDIPQPTKAFVRATMETAEQSTHEVAAAFLFGREELVPAMFTTVLGVLDRQGGAGAPRFRRYLERHIAVDAGEHAPKAAQLLVSLCSDHRRRWARAEAAAVAALDARTALWDGVLATIPSSRS